MEYDFENMSDEEFELLCREQLPALELYGDYVTEAIKKMKEKEGEENTTMKSFSSWEEVRQWLEKGNIVHCPINWYTSEQWGCGEGCCEGDCETIEEMLNWIEERSYLENLWALE